jgi:hypothetical protein
MTQFNDRSDEHDFEVEHGRAQAPRLQSKSWKKPQPQHPPKKTGPTSFNGMHRRRKRRIMW